MTTHLNPMRFKLFIYLEDKSFLWLGRANTWKYLSSLIYSSLIPSPYSHLLETLRLKTSLARSPPAPRPRLPLPWFPSDPPTISPSRQLFLAASPLLTKLIREMWLAGQVFLSSSGWQAPLSKDKIFPSRVSLLLPQDRQSHPSQSFHTLLALRMF